MKARFVVFVGILMFFALYFSNPSPEKPGFYSADFLFHFHKAAELSEPLNGIGGIPYYADTIEDYPPFFSWISSIFSFRLETFFCFVLLLFCVIFPLALFKKTGEGFVVLAWFSFTGFWFFFSGLLAQGLMAFVLLLFVYERSFLFRLILLFAALLIHSYGVFLLLAFWVFEIIFENRCRLLSLAVCIFPIANTNEKTNLNGLSLATGKNFFGGAGLLATNFLEIGRWFCLNPLLIFGLLGLKKKQSVIFWFCVFAFIFSAVFLWWRIVETLAPFFAIGLTEYFKLASKKFRILIIVGCVVSIFLLFLHNLSLMRLIGFSLSGALECAIHCFGRC